MVEKVALQLHRVTRILRLIAFHPHGQVEMRNGVICMGGVIGKEVYYFDITAAGLDLIETMVAYWFSARDSVYPESYVGWVFSEMFFDLGGEIRRYSDEGRTLYQFQRKGPFNRHFRFDCDNPKTTFEGDFVQIDIPAPYRDSARYAIDFFAVLHDVLHIIPVEALKDGKIACRRPAEMGGAREERPHVSAGGVPEKIRTPETQHQPADDVTVIARSRRRRSHPRFVQAAGWIASLRSQ